MTTVRTPPALGPTAVFAELGADHPFGTALHAFRAELADQEWPAGHVLSSEVKGRRTGTGWELDRFYSCVQTWTGDAQLPFTAATLYWTARGGRAQWFHFPADPYLPQAGPWLHPAGHFPRRYDVLRYVPLRRLTVRTGPGGREIVKFKRPTRLLDSWTRAGTVVAAAAGTSVQVPPLAGLDQQRSAYSQLAVAGPSMDRLVDVDTASGLLAQAGRIHAELHALRCPRLPVEGRKEVIDAVVHDADWLAVLRPELAGVLAGIRDRLLAAAPPPSALVTCHGDLIPSHLIGGRRGWTVIDLDLARLGDPHRDVAVFLAGLPADLAGRELADAAEEAYLQGYAERSTMRLDPMTFGWHRSAAELHQLAVAAAKDRLDGTGLRHGIERLIDRPTGGRTR